MKNTCLSVITLGLLGLWSAGCSESSTQSAGLTGPNQALFKYLGDAVATPATLDAAYSKAGLTGALQNAARAAGISLVKLEIDDSEFPFLVGVVCRQGDDMQALKEEVGSLPAYKFSGGVGGNTTFVMNLVPPSAFPADAHQRIYRRMTVRERMLFDRISEQH